MEGPATAELDASFASLRGFLVVLTGPIAGEEVGNEFLFAEPNKESKFLALTRTRSVIFCAMRNLSLAAELITALPDLSVSRTAIDLDENVLYAASESQNNDGEVEVKIWRIPQADEVGTSTVGAKHPTFRLSVTNLL